MTTTTSTTSTAMSANVKVRHVLTELLETERVYVNEISIVLKVNTHTHTCPSCFERLRSHYVFATELGVGVLLLLPSLYRIVFICRDTGINWSILTRTNRFHCNWPRKLTSCSATCQRFALFTVRSFCQIWRVACPVHS